MADVKFIRKELKDTRKRYELIRDVLGGEQAVKNRKELYLPAPDDGDTNLKATAARYIAYITRAVFYSVTKRTIDGLCGQIFQRAPDIVIPDTLTEVMTDADGSGVSVVQMAQSATRIALAYGRGGVLVDFPETSGGLTAEQLATGDVHPTMTLYGPLQIINWRTTTRGARKILSLVVLEETYVDETDEFETKEELQWRVLRLVNNAYVIQIYRKANLALPFKTINPTGADGLPLNEIPFSFIGSENNDSTIDDQPMYDIASLNIAHYRNSADYEESVFLVGQPTPVFTGLTEQWVKNVLGGKVYLGSRGSISLPQGADAKLLQASANSMPLEAMQHKEKQMVALGAKVVEKRAVVRTASEATIDATNESSVLSAVANNVSAAFTQALKWMTIFAGGDAKSVKFVLNTEYDLAGMNANDRQQLLEEWMSGALSFTELRANLRKAGIATQTDEEALAAIKKEQATLPTLKPEPVTQAPAKPAAGGE